MSGGLEGRVALVTGAGRGIGRAIALGLADAGARLVLVARSADQLADAADQIGRHGGRPETIEADLMSSEGLERVVSAVVAASPAIVVNNAATVEPLGAIDALDPEAVSGAFALNVVAPIRLAGAAVSAMVDAGWGRIVTVSSGIVARPATMVGGGVYAATKAAVEAQTVNLAAELTGTGVTANAYRPGGVDTAMQAWIREQDPARIGEALRSRFVDSHRSGSLISAERSAAALLRRIGSDATGEIWDVHDPE